MLLAYEKGAELIVAVGTHNSMVEFLDKGRAGMASTFLVRMKVGDVLVDAKGVSRLYRSSVRTMRPRVADPGRRLHARRGADAVRARPARPPRLLALALLGLMINFRFHIVSLTAVLLALGIGLVLGTTFLDDATINGLERQLDGLENDLDRAQARNDEQQTQLEAYREEADAARRAARASASTPASSRATRCSSCRPAGIDGELVDGVTSSLVQADADVLGVWWLTDRMLLDDESEVADLADALELSTDDVDRLRRNLAVQLADVLYGAVRRPGEPGRPMRRPGRAAAAGPAARGRVRRVPAARRGRRRRGAPAGVGDCGSSSSTGPTRRCRPTEVIVPVLVEMTADGPMPGRRHPAHGRHRRRRRPRHPADPRRRRA